MDTVIVRLFNATRVQIISNNSALAIFNGSFVGLTDGVYYMNVTANDTENNQNSSETRTFRVDTTVPVITHSCDYSTISAGAALTCTCTATDATSGIDTISYTASPSTTTGVGATTTTCTVNDTAGNSLINTFSYTVTSDGTTTTTSGGGSTSYTKTYAEDSKEFSEVKTVTKGVKKNEKIRIKFQSETHNIGVTGLTTTSAEIEVFSILQKATMNIGDEKMFDLDDDDYYDLKVKLNSIANNKADLTLESINVLITPENEDQGVTEIVDGVVQEEGEISEVETSNLNWIWIGVIVVIAIGIVLYVLKKRRE